MSVSHLINANIHRIKEGARVLEEVARFVLRDETLFQDIRSFRHQLSGTPPILNAPLDLGGPLLQEDNTRHDLLAIVQANALRIQEALRVLEEVSNDNVSKQKMKALRYHAYQLQATLYQRALAFIRQDKLRGLYLIIDLDQIQVPIEQIVTVINQSSVNLVQLRSQSLSKHALLQRAITCKTLLHPDKLLIINRHLDIALDVGDGIHLMPDDYPIERVKKLLPDNFVFGVTCYDLAAARDLAKQGVSYLAVGNLFIAEDNKADHYLSLPELQAIQQTVSLPICAMGNIQVNNLSMILTCNVEMVAVNAGIWQETDPLSLIQQIQW